MVGGWVWWLGVGGCGGWVGVGRLGVVVGSRWVWWVGVVGGWVWWVDGPEECLVRWAVAVPIQPVTQMWVGSQ